MVLLGGALLTHAVAAAASSQDAFLRELFTLSAGDLQHVHAGRAIARTLPASDNREVALFGVVRIPVSPDVYVRRMQSLTLLRAGDDVLAVGSFSRPPRLDDLGALELDAADRRELRRCGAGDCDIRLPAGAIGRFRNDVHWDAPGAPRDAAVAMRQVIRDVVATYRQTGAQPVYESKERRTSVASEFRDLAESDQVVLPQFPLVRRNLLTSSADGLVADQIYWMRAKIGPKRVVTVTHLTIAHTDARTPVKYVAASRQIYADYYFDASLGLTLLLDDVSAGAPATLVVYVNRSRVNAFHGILGGITRRIVRSRARSALEHHLQELQRLVMDRAL